MVPLLICLPVFSATRPGYVCFMQNRSLLWVLSGILYTLVAIVFIINIIDVTQHFSLAYIPLFLFICSILTFVTLGIAGLKVKQACKPSCLIRAAFWVWCFTWFGLLIFCIYSTWNSTTLKNTSINNRCPLVLWIADWCYKIQLRNSENYARRSKRSLTNLGASESWTDQGNKFALGYYLGTAFWIIFMSVMFTLYGYTINNVLEQMTTQPFIVTLAPLDQDEENNLSTSKENVPNTSKEPQ